MDKDYFIKLLQKYRQGRLTKEEEGFLNDHYDLYQNEPDVLDTLGVEEKQALSHEIKEAIWDKVAKKEKTLLKIRFIKKGNTRWAAVAAVFTVVFSSLLLYKFSSPNHNTAGRPAQSTRLTASKQEDTAGAFHQKENRVIFLPDGSTVFLSPGSKLNYPSTFDGLEKREVFLDGQAFFDIKHNVSRPFIVHTGKLQTTVLGTAFNIKAIPGEMNIIITVKRGKVKVSDDNKTLGIITPNHQINYDRQNNTAVANVVDSDGYLEWKDQDLFIDNLTLSEAAKILEYQYKITIEISDSSIKGQRFTATFPRNEKLEQALESISVFNGLTYSFNHDKSIVMIGNK